MHQFAQRQHTALLPVAPDVLHIAADGRSGQRLHQNRAGAGEVIRPVATARVIQRNRKATRRRRAKPPFNRRPRSQLIGEADDGKIPAEGRAEHRRRAERRRHPRHNLDLVALFRHAQQERRHTVNLRVARADQRHAPAFPRKQKSLYTPFLFAAHARRHKPLFGKLVPNQLDIRRVAHDHLRTAQCVVRRNRAPLASPRPDAHDLNHTFSSPASASVTPCIAVLPTSSRPPVITAARSHTQPQPTVFITKSE